MSFGELHAPVPVTPTLPIEAPREALRLGRVLIAQPNWVCDRDVARTNNTTAVVEAQVTDVGRSVGLETSEAERIASAQIAGGVVGAAGGAVALGVPAAAAGVLAGGTLGGLSGAALGGLVPTPILGLPVVTTGVAGTAVGAGIGAAALGVPAAALGAVGGGLAGVAAGTAYGAGEHASQLEVAVPDIEHDPIVADTTTQVERWSADPAAAAAVEAVRTVVTDTAPALDTQARAVVTAQPGGEQVVEQADRVLTGVFTDTTPGLAAQLLATAVGDGLAGAAPDRKKGVHPMNLSRLKRTPARHPAVIDLLGPAPTAAVSAGAGTFGADSGEAAVGPGGRGKKAVVVLGAAAAAVAGAVLLGRLGGGSDIGAPDRPASTGTPAVEHGVSSLALPAVEPAAEQENSAPGQCHAERGDQASGPGVIAAFNFAYYSLRNGEAARALATPTTSVLPAPQLQTHIDHLPVGTTYCQKITEISAEVYLVASTVRRPGQPAEHIAQTVSTQKLDGRWFVDVFA